MVLPKHNDVVEKKIYFHFAKSRTIASSTANLRVI